MKDIKDNLSPGSEPGDKLKQALDELLGSDDGTDVEIHKSMQQIHRDNKSSLFVSHGPPKTVGITSTGKLSYPRNSRTTHDAKTVGLGYGAAVQITSDSGCLTFGEKEEQIRSKGNKHKFTYFLKSNMAAFLVFLFYLISLESVLSCIFTVGLTIYWYYNALNNPTEKPGWTGGGLDWVVLGFAVVTPITVSIGMAFTRRERALFHLSRLRASTFQIYLAHAIWTNWNDGREGAIDRTDTWLQHADLVMEHLIGIGDEISRFLSLPTSSRSYHRMLKNGRKEAAEIVELQYRLFDSLYTKRITTLTILVETLKTQGLSTTECSRIRHFERDVGEAIEGLRVIKMYRTPIALRSFGRLFTVLLPPLYAASFAQLAFEMYSLPMGIIFAIITPLCLTALFESMTNLEDPFVGWITLDGIDCVEEFEVLHFHQLKSARSEIFPNAPSFASNQIKGAVSYEALWQPKASGDIFDVSMIDDDSVKSLDDKKSSFRRLKMDEYNDRSLRTSHIDRSNRTSHFAIMDKSTRSDRS